MSRPLAWGVALGCAASTASGAAAFWGADGGNPQRTSSLYLDTDITQPLSHWTAKYSSNVEDTTSEVEEYLLQSPLVTSTGYVVVATDDCSILLLPDPANNAANAPWLLPGGLGSKYKWRAPAADDPDEECVAAGLALDNNNAIYFLDGRNELLYKIIYTMTGFTPTALQWTSSFFGNKLKFENDVSMLFVPGATAGTGTLWVPLEAALNGNSGTAAVVNPVDGSIQFVPNPTGGCRPDDFGSAGLSNGQLALLGHEDCGMVVINAQSTPPAYIYQTYPASKYLFDYGEHSHPVFDAGSNNLYFVDWAVDMLRKQQMCCINTVTYEECTGWATTCTQVPAESTEEWPEGTAYYRWEWLAPAIFGNYLYLAASGTFQDKVIIDGMNQLESGLFVWDVTTGKLVSSWRMRGDMINSQPLIVQGNTGDVRVFVLTTLGNLYSFGAGSSISNGPLWISSDVTGIPADDLPATTYCYLSVTPKGTILVTASAGGADWADEKMFYGIVNGIYPPPVPGIPAGLAPGAAAAVAVLVIGLAGGLVGAYYKVPTFTNAVNSAASMAATQASALGDMLAKNGVPLPSLSAQSSSAEERSGLLKGSLASSSTTSSSATSTAPTFTGASASYGTEL